MSLPCNNDVLKSFISNFSSKDLSVSEVSNYCIVTGKYSTTNAFYNYFNPNSDKQYQDLMEMRNHALKHLTTEQLQICENNIIKLAQKLGIQETIIEPSGRDLNFLRRNDLGSQKFCEEIADEVLRIIYTGSPSQKYFSQSAVSKLKSTKMDHLGDVLLKLLNSKADPFFRNVLSDTEVITILNEVSNSKRAYKYTQEIAKIINGHGEISSDKIRKIEAKIQESIKEKGIPLTILETIPQILSQSIEKAVLNRIIQQLASQFCAARDQTYEGEPNANCDLVIPARMGGVIHLDGVGHNNRVIVEHEHPKIHEFADKWSRFIESFDFNQEDALNIFKNEEKKIFHSFNNKSADLLRTYENLKGEESKNLTKLASLFEKNGPLSQIEFDSLYKWVEKSKLKMSIQSAEKEKITDELDNEIRDLFLKSYYCLAEKNKDGFDESIKAIQKIKNELNAINNPREYLQAISSRTSLLLKCFSPIPLCGSAFGLTQPLPINEGYVHFRNIADVCLMVIAPKDTTIKRNENGTIDKTSISIEWVKDAGSDTELGGAGRIPEPKILGPYPDGAILFSFSDGIGEFLSEDEIVEEFCLHSHQGMPKLLEILKSRILNSSQNADEGNRYQASALGQRECKVHDPLNAGKYDDLTGAITSLPKKRS